MPANVKRIAASLKCTLTLPLFLLAAVSHAGFWSLARGANPDERVHARAG